MALVVPGVARFALNQTLEGRSVVNVLDYRIDTTGSTMSRNDAVDGQAGSIIEHWCGSILPNLVDDLTLDSVTYVDLNAADGITGSRLTGGGFTLPEAGTSINAALVANTAALITKQTTSARGQRNGRIFLAGLTEGDNTDANSNVIGSGTLAALQSDFDAFLTNTNEIDSLGTAFSSEMVVVSVTSRDGAGNPLTGVGNTVSALVVNELLATQRRRLRG